MLWDSLSWVAWVALGALAAYLAVALALYAFQRRLIYPASREAPEAAPLGGRLPRVLETRAADGVTCRHWLWLPQAGKPVICFLQGNAGHMGHRQESHGFLVEAGYGLLLVGYRGYGGNPGKPDEAGLTADARAALAALRETLPGVPLVLYGESLGAAVAVALAAEGETAPLVLDGPFDRLSSPAGHRYRWLPVERLLKDRWPSVERIGKVRQPLLWLHGSDDPVTPAWSGRRLFEAAPGPKTERVVPGGGHVDLLEDPETRALLLSWLEADGAAARPAG